MVNGTPSLSPKENIVAATEAKTATSPATGKDAQVDKPKNTDQANTGSGQDGGDKMDVDEGSATRTGTKTAVGDDTTDAPKGDQSKVDANQAAKGGENIAAGSGNEKEKVEGAENDSADPSRKSARQRKGGATTTPKPTKKKSSGNLKGKTPRSTKKATVDVDYQPGMNVLAKMRTFPPWPAIILSNELLPEALLRTKPSGKTGKKGEASASASTAPSVPTSWPVMFMGTNEYSWMSISNLEPLDNEKLANAPKGSKSKPLQEAWSVARSGLNLDDVKSFQDSIEMDVDDFSVEEGPVGLEEGVGVEGSPEVDDDDLGVEEVDESEEEEEETPKQKKSAKKTSNKKRKKSDSVSDDEDDTLPDKPAKTPKKAPSAKTPKKSQAKTPQTAKGAKTPSNGTAKSRASGKGVKKSQAKDDRKSPAPRKKATKSANRVVDSDSDSAPKTSGKRGGNGEKRTKEILYLRHRMQRGFLSKGKMPIADDMPAMDKYFSVLEGHTDIDGDSIRATKINKVLKAIVKLDIIPKDDEFRFRKRALTLLEKWDKILAEKAPDPSSPAVERENGVKGDGDVEMKDDKDADEKESGGESKEDEPKAREKKKIVDVSVPLTPTKETDSAGAGAKSSDEASAEKAETATA